MMSAAVDDEWIIIRAILNLGVLPYGNRFYVSNGEKTPQFLKLKL